MPPFFYLGGKRVKNNKRYLLQVHGAVLLFGLSGLFGKLD